MSRYPEDQELPYLGALCLDYTDDIYRPPGDPLNPLSFRFPLIYEIVKDGTVRNIVFGGKFNEQFFDNFVDACEKLQKRGAVGVITSCGFLAQIQQRLNTRSPIPVATSSLLQLPFVLSITSGKVAVLTFDGRNLGKLHFDGIGLTQEQQERVSIFGCADDGHLKNFIIYGGSYIAEELENELLELALAALSKEPTISAFVLECTQMPPTSKAIHRATGKPVYDAVTMIDHFYTGLVPRTFPDDDHKEEGLRVRNRSEKELG
jgi:hypothetical protein